MLGCHPKLGGAPTKIETHPHKQKKFQNMAVDASRCCREVLLHVYRHCVEALNKNDTALKGKKGTLNNASHATKNYFETTRTTPTTLHKPPCSTRPPLFTQPGQLNSHKPRLQQLRLHRLSRCTNSISTTTNNNIP